MFNRYANLLYYRTLHKSLTLLLQNKLYEGTSTLVTISACHVTVCFKHLMKTKIVTPEKYILFHKTLKPGQWRTQKIFMGGVHSVA